MEYAIIIVVFLLISATGIKMQQRKVREYKEQLFDEKDPLLGRPVISTEPHNFRNPEVIKEIYSVTGSAVIRQRKSAHWKAALIALFKGEKAYEKELKRASKEAVFNMKLSAKDAHLIVNTKVQTSIIKSEKATEPAQVYAVAYGTAVTYY